MKTKPCFSISQNRTMIGAVASPLRHNFVYLIVRTVLRILFVSIGPNVFIFVVTILTVNILRVSNKSRRKLFRMNQSLIEQYASRENNQTLLALMIAVKFLVLRGLVFAIDLFEVIIGFNDPNFPLLNQFMSYAVDISNLFVIINSATNCMMYLKGAQWLDSKFNDRQTIKRKKTICEEGQLLGDRLTILCTSWDKVMKNTGGELGTRIAWNMLRKHPTMLNLKNDEPEKVSLLNGSCKRSIDHVKLKEIGNRITAFIYELLDLMKNSQTEDVITCRIRRVGAVHYDRKINFKTSLFKEFKNTILCAVADCEYDTPEERDLAIESWNIFTSFIIKEMKMGTWVMNDNVHQVP
ncbi:unnamed protein product [Caenorhabditis angaria]|uniref:G-protein coupled receptors family 1 profile domain-containing protein n=1 Tax=Caenorhabditis angaria TaxID=860376 RepID=A0A9P1N887_9PELO|nr:unnamed protein product [Caenorhabditis angaria]